ncbi:MAG TPA: LysR substrate-binding domain-containing protein [Candidatus Polarisedimenticolia bacterium]|nr:LysR substrate-binding domain-containing protein [Candidatus Polarisedimenticolia bacterium]
MELRHLRYFVAVAEAENVSRAALKLHVSQPGISRQIRDLEDEIGFQLFQRSAKSIKLTDAGKIFLTEAKAVLQRANDAVKTARAIATGEQGELHVGYAGSPTVRILPPTLRAFQAESPQVRVRLHDLSTEEMLGGLRDGKLQLALLVCPTPGILRGLGFAELTGLPIRLAVAPQHPLARMRSVPLTEIAKQPLIGFNHTDYPDYAELLENIFSAVKLKPRIAEEHDSAASLIAAVESGSGVAVVTDSLACVTGPRLKFLQLSPEPKPLVLGAAWAKNELTPAAERFLKCARQAAAADDK